MDLKTYLASLASCRRLQEGGLTPRLLIGHGFGEIAAMVAAGAFSISEGAEIVVARFHALADGAAARHGLASLEASPLQVKILLKLLRNESISLAAENSSHDSVIVGPSSALPAAADLAGSLDIPFELVTTNRAPHHPGLTQAAAAFSSRLRQLRRQPLRRPVFSPLRQRLYRDSDDLIDCLAEQLVAPVRFADAVAHLVRDGVGLLVECGPLRGLASTLDCDAVTDTEFFQMQQAGAIDRTRSEEFKMAGMAREVA